MDSDTGTDFFNLGRFTSICPRSDRSLTDLHVSGSPRAWSYAELDEASGAAARGLLAAGFAKGERIAILKGERIAILGENSAEFLIAYSAIMRAGLVAVPVNHRFPGQIIAHILRDCSAVAMFEDTPRPATADVTLRRLALYGEDDASLHALIRRGRAASATPLDAAPQRDELAYILYTAGSTGLPKGVLLDHRGQSWSLSCFVRRFANIGPMSALVVAPYYHMQGLFFSMTCMAAGIPFVLLPRFEAREYIAALLQYRCEILAGIPTMFAMILRERELIANADFSFVRSVTLGSSPLPRKLFDELQALFPNATISNVYGTTEGGPYIFGSHPAGLPTPPLSLGYPVPDIELELVEQSEPNCGTLRIRSPAVAKGYLNLPEQTARRLGGGWYYTGDVMRRDENGFYFYVGRADDMFICGGENVFPSEVEALLERHPGIAQAAVVPVDDAIKGQLPLAFVVLKPGSRLSPADIKAYALSEGPAFSHPRYVEIVNEIPVAPSHKYDRRALIARAREIASASPRK